SCKVTFEELPVTRLRSSQRVLGELASGDVAGEPQYSDGVSVLQDESRAGLQPNPLAVLGPDLQGVRGWPLASGDALQPPMRRIPESRINQVGDTLLDDLLRSIASGLFTCFVQSCEPALQVVAVNDVARIVEEFPIAFTQDVFPFLAAPEELLMFTLVAPHDCPPTQASHHTPGQHSE